MKNKSINLRFGVICLIVLAAALSRLLFTAMPNFTPLGAMALFGGAYFSKRIYGIILPLVALWVSDLVLNNVIYAQYYDGFVWASSGFYWIYGAFAAIALVGALFLKNNKSIFKSVLPVSLLSGILFFLVSNFGVWMSGTMYPMTFEGLTACYAAAIPFFQNTMLSYGVFSIVLFAGFEYLQKTYPSLNIHLGTIK